MKKNFPIVDSKSMFLKQCFTLILLFVLSSPPVQAQTIELSIEQALIKMKTQSLAIKGSEANRVSHENDRKTMRGNYLPKVSLSATYMKMNEDLGLDISPISQAVGQVANLPASKTLPSTLVLQNEEFGVLGVNMIWPIFTGGKIYHANKAMDAQIRASISEIDQTIDALNTELIERYFGYRLGLKALELYQTSYETMKLHQDHAQKMEANGMISKAQRLFVEISVSEAQMEMQRSEKQIATVKQALVSTLGDTIDIKPISELFMVKNIEPLDFFIEAAQGSNAQLQQVDAKRELAFQNYRIQQSNYYPTLAVVANKELINNNLSHLVPDWFVGVNMRWIIFDGAARTYKVKSAKATVDRVEFLRTKAQIDITVYVSKLYNELMTHVQQLETLEKTYEFANEYVRIQEKAFAEGFATTKDVVDAQLTMSKVKVGRIKILNDYILTLAKLLEVTGQRDRFLEYSQRADREGEDF